MRPHTGLDVDLRHGIAYAVKRRAKLLPYLLAVAAFAVSDNLLHGTALHWTEVGIGLAGAVGVHQIPAARKRR